MSPEITDDPVLVMVELASTANGVAVPRLTVGVAAVAAEAPKAAIVAQLIRQTAVAPKKVE
jgi:hypothetical protein